MNKFLTTAILTSTLLTGYQGAVAADTYAWNLGLLFHPSAQQLNVEKKGRVVIYDGVKDVDVERALDAQFDRIGSMMFIRTIVTDGHGEPKKDAETGFVIVEDDC